MIKELTWGGYFLGGFVMVIGIIIPLMYIYMIY